MTNTNETVPASAADRRAGRLALIYMFVGAALAATCETDTVKNHLRAAAHCDQHHGKAKTEIKASVPAYK